MTDKPRRVQLSRKKGWRMPPNTMSVARPGRHGNPFNIGGYHKIGNGGPGMSRITCLDPKYADESFTLVETNEQAVAMFREWRRLYPLPKHDSEELRGRNLACWCPLDKPCHADVLIELANAPIQGSSDDR
jgi:hypothetical protein